MTPGLQVTSQEYERLPEDVRHEYIDGKVVVSPFPSGRHALTVAKLMTLIQATLPPTHVALSHFGWKPGRDEFGPDVMVVPVDAVDLTRFEGLPPLVVEVVSTNRSTDLIVKVQKYARACAPRYWIVDLQLRTLLSLVLVDGTYQVAAQLDDDNPVAALETGLGTVTVTLPDLLA